MEIGRRGEMCVRLCLWKRKFTSEQRRIEEKKASVKENGVVPGRRRDLEVPEASIEAKKKRNLPYLPSRPSRNSLP